MMEVCLRQMKIMPYGESDLPIAVESNVGLPDVGESGGFFA